MQDVAGRPSWVCFDRIIYVKRIFLLNECKQEWLFIIEGSMAVGIALILLPLLTDYPLQSKQFFLSTKMQLYAVSNFPNRAFCTKCPFWLQWLTSLIRSGRSRKRTPELSMTTPNRSGGDYNKHSRTANCTCSSFCRWLLLPLSPSTISSPL